MTKELPEGSRKRPLNMMPNRPQRSKSRRHLLVRWRRGPSSLVHLCLTLLLPRLLRTLSTRMHLPLCRSRHRRQETFRLSLILPWRAVSGANLRSLCRLLTRTTSPRSYHSPHAASGLSLLLPPSPQPSPMYRTDGSAWQMAQRSRWGLSAI